MLRETDVHVCVPHDSTPHIHEAHQIALHGLCDGLDLQLLGDEEKTS
jgi:D-sedoheptulose 7-phosphate isomerase